MKRNKETVGLLIGIKGYHEHELEFFKECFETILKCRQILKWSHVEAFYANKNMDFTAETIFTDLQEILEKHCEETHVYIERDLQ